MVNRFAGAPAAWLQQQLGQAVLGRRAVGGGCIHAAWRVELADGAVVFVKTNSAPLLPLLQAEADGLAALAAVAPNGLQVPVPLACGEAGEQALLVLPWLELLTAPGAGPSAWRDLGRALARLHRASVAAGPGRGRFGWQRDNVIGSTPQPNGWHDDWGLFFAERRLGHQLQLAAARGLPLRRGAALLAQVPSWLGQHKPEAVLVHGDLWSGNAALLAGGGGTVYDPAVYRADREVDLAMTRLFGGFPAAFEDGYQEEWPLPPDAETRVELYNLYHLLNHANLFGGGYVTQAQASINRLLDQAQLRDQPRYS